MENRTGVELDLTDVFGPDPLTEGIRGKLKELIGVLVQGELDEALKIARYGRSDKRTGFRNGKKGRKRHTSMGTVGLEMPRARILKGDGKSGEWQSQLVPRYERRSKSLDAMLVSMYISGTNLRRIKRTLKPLLTEAPLDKNVVSRLVGRLSAHVEAWKTRSLAAERYVYVYLDAPILKVRLFKKVRKLPILVALGVRQDGQKEVLGMDVLMKENEAAWTLFLQDLVERGLNRPLLTIIDGHRGLRNAVDEVWPEIPVQRSTVHKLRNIEKICLNDAYPLVKEDFHRIVNADSHAEGLAAYKAFVRKWSADLPKVVRSLEEAGEDLLTFHKYPGEQWKSLKTTNPIERLNLEFKRRVKTQCSLPSEKSAILLLYGLLLSGQIRFRRINGWKTIVQVLGAREDDLNKKAS